jgi:hypothetical protein
VRENAIVAVHLDALAGSLERASSRRMWHLMMRHPNVYDFEAALLEGRPPLT